MAPRSRSRSASVLTSAGMFPADPMAVVRFVISVVTRLRSAISTSRWMSGLSALTDREDAHGRLENATDEDQSVILSLSCAGQSGNVRSFRLSFFVHNPLRGKHVFCCRNWLVA